MAYHLGANHPERKGDDRGQGIQEAFTVTAWHFDSQHVLGTFWLKKMVKICKLKEGEVIF